MPANIAIDDSRVQFEMTRYLSDNWAPILEKDVDGPGSLPLKIDTEVPNLGKFAATRRVARTIYLGSAPTTDAAHHGIEDRRIKLGCVMPGESPAVFGDALRRLAGAATYLYQDGSHYWYSTQPTVTKTADDRAEQLKREPDKIIQELDGRLRADLKQKGDFERIHPFPHGGQDVPDDRDTRLVVLAVDHSHSKEPGSAAEQKPSGYWSHVARLPASTATASSSSLPTRIAFRTSMRPPGNISPGLRSSRSRSNSTFLRSRSSRRNSSSRTPTV